MDILNQLRVTYQYLIVITNDHLVIKIQVIKFISNLINIIIICI